MIHLLSVASDRGICFCRGQPSDHVISCSNMDCPYSKFHSTCLSLSDMPLLKIWYCPYCSRLPQVKQKRKAKKSKEPHAVNQAAMKCTCICNISVTSTDRLLECHRTSCGSGHYFQLSCLGLERMPNNAKTTWQCEGCRKKNKNLV